MLKEMWTAILTIVSSLASFFRIREERRKAEEDRLNAEKMIKQKELQDKIDQKDKDELLIGTVVEKSGEEREKALEELRKIVST